MGRQFNIQQRDDGLYDATPCLQNTNRSVYSQVRNQTQTKIINIEWYPLHYGIIKAAQHVTLMTTLFIFTVKLNSLKEMPQGMGHSRGVWHIQKQLFNQMNKN